MKKSESLKLGLVYEHLHQVLHAEKELVEETFHYGMGARVHLALIIHSFYAFTDMSVGHVLDAAKTITIIRIRLSEKDELYTKTLFLTDRHQTIKPLFDHLDEGA